MGGRIRHERDDECGGHEPVALEELAGRDRTQSGDHRDDDCSHGQSEGNDAHHDRSPASSEGSAVGEGPSHFLFEREEEAGGQNESGEPQGHDRLEVVLAQSLLAHLEEGVTRQTGDQQTDSDGEGALRKRRAGVSFSRRQG